MTRLWDLFGILLLILAVPLVGVGAIFLYQFYYPLLGIKDGLPAGMLSVFSSIGIGVGLTVLYFYCGEVIDNWRPRKKKPTPKTAEKPDPKPTNWR